ncbi:MAG TPA: hypothetical protein VLC51_04900 [Nitrospira sp.]|nr:hypothetical protein [Nitrospira sp.]
MNDPNGISYPAWTPDGKFLQYASGSTPAFNRVKLGGSHVQQIFTVQNSNPFGTNVGPWSSITPDGSMMYTRDVSTQNIYLLDVDFP